MAPDLLRADSLENIYLQADVVSGPVTVLISIQDFGKTTMLFQDSLVLNQENGFQALKSIQASGKNHDATFCKGGSDEENSFHLPVNTASLGTFKP